MDSLTMALPWSTALLRMDVFVDEFAPFLELPLKTFRTFSPFITIAGLGVVVWWRGRRDGGEMQRCVEVTVEMPTPYTLLCVFGYLTATLLVLDFRIPLLLLPFALLGTCNPRLSTQRPTDVGGGPATPGTSVETVDQSFRNVTPSSGFHSRKLFHIHDDDDFNSPLPRGANPNLLLTPPPTVSRRRHVSYSPQTLPTPRTERPSFRTRVASTPSDEIRRTRKGSTNRRPVSENYDENLVPKKEVWDTSFELLLYNLSKSRSRQSSLVQPQPRFNVSSPISPLAPSPLIHSS